MKLRIRGSSVRFRLQQAEVHALLARGYIEEHTQLGTRPEERFTYRVELSGEALAVAASWSAGRLAVSIPNVAAREWADGEALGLEATQSVGEGEVLRILIEKDLACVVPRSGEDDRDAYPNPADRC
jgi:hypothetical protein